MTDPRDKHKHKDKHNKHKEQGKHAHVNKYADLIGKTGSEKLTNVIKTKDLKKEFTPHLDKPTAAKDQYTRDEAQKHKFDQKRK